MLRNEWGRWNLNPGQLRLQRIELHLHACALLSQRLTFQAELRPLKENEFIFDLNMLCFQRHCVDISSPYGKTEKIN